MGAKQEEKEFAKQTKAIQDRAEARFTDEFAKWVDENFPPKKDGK